MWLFNTAALSYTQAGGKCGMSAVEHEQLLRTLHEEIVTGDPSLNGSTKPLMRRIGTDEAPPSWLREMPTNPIAARILSSRIRGARSRREVLSPRFYALHG